MIKILSTIFHSDFKFILLSFYLLQKDPDSFFLKLILSLSIYSIFCYLGMDFCLSFFKHAKNQDIDVKNQDGKTVIKQLQNNDNTRENYLPENGFTSALGDTYKSTCD